MPGFAVDFSEAREFILVPIGQYNVHVAAASVKTSSRSGTEMLSIQLVIDEIVEMDEDTEFTPDQVVGQRLFTNWMLGGAGAGITKQAFQAIYGQDGEGNPLYIPSDCDELVDQVLRVQITHQIYAKDDGGDDQPRARVSRYYAVA